MQAMGETNFAWNIWIAPIPSHLGASGAGKFTYNQSHESVIEL